MQITKELKMSKKVDIAEIDNDLEILNQELSKNEKRQDDILKSFDVGEYSEHEDYEDGAFYEMDGISETICEISKEISRLERLKNIKQEGDSYISLYPNGYKTTLFRQNDIDVEDLLKRKDEAEKVAEKIKNKEIKTIGVFGEWGTGKSTFLEYIKAQLRDDDFLPVKIDASEYSDQEKIWAYIYSKIRDELESKKLIKSRITFKTIKKHIHFVLIDLGLSLILGGSILYPTIVSFRNTLINSTDNNFITIAEFIVIIIAYIYLFFKYVFKEILEVNCGLNNIRNWIKKNTFAPSQDDALGYKAEIKKDFDELLEICNKQIVLFVDEIDRCDDDVVAKFFDTIQLFQHSPMIQIVYAVDRNIVEQALVKKGIPEKSTDKYLKKYIDYGINILPVNKESDALEKIIRKYNVTEVELMYIHTFILNHLEVNLTVRDLKEILNILCEIKKEWLNKYIFTQKYEYEENYVISFIKFIPWAIYALTDSKWIMYMNKDIPSESSIRNNAYYEKMFKELISTDEMKKTYKDCPKYLMESKIMDIIYYKKLISKYKVV